MRQVSPRGLVPKMFICSIVFILLYSGHACAQQTKLNEISFQKFADTSLATFAQARSVIESKPVGEFRAVDWIRKGNVTIPPTA